MLGLLWSTLSVDEPVAVEEVEEELEETGEDVLPSTLETAYACCPRCCWADVASFPVDNAALRLEATEYLRDLHVEEHGCTEELAFC